MNAFTISIVRIIVWVLCLFTLDWIYTLQGGLLRSSMVSFVLLVPYILGVLEGDAQ